MKAQANLILNDLVFGTAILLITVAGVALFEFSHTLDEDADEHRVNTETSYSTRVLLNTELEGIKLYERIRLGESEDTLLQRIANEVRKTLNEGEAWIVWIDTAHVITKQDIRSRDNVVSTFFTNAIPKYKEAPRITIPTVSGDTKPVLFQFISSDELIKLSQARRPPSNTQGMGIIT